MGPLSAEETLGIRTKGQQVGGVQNKRAGNVVSVSTLCCSRLYCHEKGIMKTINKAYWARERLKFWDGGGKKKQKGMPADVADSSIGAFPPLFWTTDIHDSPSPHNAYEVKITVGKKAYRKFGYDFECECSFNQLC